MRILLAGVPFGCDNVGDEAILECAVAIFREVCPEAHITASTRDRERTARRLGIETCGLLGFGTDVSPADTEAIIAAHDCFVWCGATGLSDYPHVTPRLMRLAQKFGKKTILWGVGMNSELNPFIFKIHPGRRQNLLNALKGLTLGAFNAIASAERRLTARARRKIAQCLNAADLIVVRDAPSRDELLKCGVTRDIVVGIDSAILMKPASIEDIPLPPGMRDLLSSGKPKIGLCVSSQGPIAEEGEFAACLDQIVLEADACIVAVPMNPLTDSALMARLAGKMTRRDRIIVLTGEYLPSEILAVAARMNVIVSSRLHLLILAAIVGVPIIGIARGSKVDNFLLQFGLSPVGNVNDCDFSTLKSEVLRMLNGVRSFRERCAEVHLDNMRRLDLARNKLGDLLAGLRP